MREICSEARTFIKCLFIGRYHELDISSYSPSTGLNSAEVYCIQSNEWRMIAPMSTRRSSVGVGVLAGFLYAVGGYDGASRQCLSTVERYDVDNDQVSLMLTFRSALID